MASLAAEGDARAQTGRAGGSVAPAKTASVSYYAASRFAEQAAFGPTPELVAELQRKGFERWVDEQLSMPASQIDPAPYLHFTSPIPDEDLRRYHAEFANLAVGGPDQLRLRLTWSLSQFLVVSERRGDPVGVIYWVNLLQQHVTGTYGALLYQVSINPMMGQYLDNIYNRPKSAHCRECAPNENYARELMQLFTIGVAKLAPNGTPQRDARGRFVEAYHQRDVEELARALTGWRPDPEPAGRPGRNWANWAKPMVPTASPGERDSGPKVVLSHLLPAGQSPEKDLRDIIDLLTSHPNAAPFVARRLIQHLVKSDPTPAYVGRVAAAFARGDRGARGDLKAVVKTILFDPEARAGDAPSAARPDDGKFREPFLHNVAMWRGLGCMHAPAAVDNVVAVSSTQRPFAAESVFGFYAPSDRAPGTRLLAPEQRLLTPLELRERLALVERPSVRVGGQGARRWPGYDRAGCQLKALRAAFVHSPKAFNDCLETRYFRGAMPPRLRDALDRLLKDPHPPWDPNDPDDGATHALAFALASPYFGVSK
jgi:uncharacterized protein (DUF1800 family)